MIRHQDAAPHANLKRPAVILSAIAVAVMVSLLLTVPGMSQEAPQTTGNGAELVAGIRLLHDAHFYLVTGLMTDYADALVGIGFNNGFWVGGHARINIDEAGTVAGYAGLEISILPTEYTNEWIPAIPIGFAYRDGKLSAALGARIVPAVRDEPVDVGFFVQFNYAIFAL